MSAAGLSVRDIVVRFGPVTAVDHIDLDVAPGEIIALLGASGSGKSSLLRGIAGLEPIAGGSVAWDGLDLSRTPVHQRGFGVMFQDGQLFPHRDVGGNVAYGIAGLPRAERQARVTQLLHLVGLAGYEHRAITTLSGGQAQRVALARSLAPRPRLLLLDEPLSALDRALRERLVGMLRTTLKATETTAVYVTHDQDEAFAVADRVAVLIDGRIAQIGSPGEVWRDPARADVAHFLGYSPLLPAGVAAGLGYPDPLGDKLVAVGPGGLVTDPAGRRLEIVEQVDHRGYAAIRVRIPGDGTAVVRAPAQVPETAIAVRLDPAQCAVVAASPDGADRSGAPTM
ncbi:Fe(3+) ions import ATP-binding protein FbpC [Nostocoides australiense Ben110]|uniref:ABC-type quaternary amine transporter n=1 Tax=Nostocoides australiense Ben110 TaxID=1193182 RepID=W6JSL2_9MICO|nr:ABC transporter ATP-binding protein [Tetrasphaera australiensis]CCH71958.1 Fe(3+) ions import ATP-binding protein FbpC [Tetrasphaera australiensis Ben110]